MTALVEFAGPGDAGQILTVQRAAFVAEAQLYGDPFIAPLVESLAQLRAALSDDTVVLKAISGERLSGVVRGRLCGRTCVASRLAVAPDLQRSGVGTALMTALERTFAGRADQIALFTGHLSQGNLRLCRRLGYVEVRRERMAAHLTLVHLRKSLAAATPSQ